MVKFVVKAVMTGFCLSLGAAVFKKISKELGLEDNDKAKTVNQQDGATDPSLH